MADIRTIGSVIVSTIKSLLPTTPWVADWDAGGKRLRNLGAPDVYTDVARKNEVDIVGFAADAAATAATTAHAVATAAQTDATSALANAATAQTTANSASTAASNAQGTADEAQTTADTALANAATAQSTASGAATTAATALTTAQAAAPATRTLTAGSGLTGGGTLAADRSFALDFGTGATQVRPGNDAAYTNARTPTAHSTTHTSVGSDPLSAADIGAVPEGRSITAGTGLTGGGDLTANRTLAVSFGTTVGTVAQGNDSRFSDARTPTSHAASHQDGGSDEINVAGLMGVLAEAQRANKIVATEGDLSVGSLADGEVLIRSGATIVSAALPTGDITSVSAGSGLTGGATSGPATLSVDFGTGTNQVRHGDDATYTNDRTASGLRSATTVVAVSTAAAPSAGQVLTATSSTAAAWSDPAGDITAVTAGSGLTGGGTSGALSLAADFGTGAGKVVQGNDSRLSDARTPTAHAGTHATGQSDAIAPSDIGAVPTSRTVSAGTGLTGGGDLTANRSFAVSYGTTAGTAAQGNDARLSDDRTSSGIRTATTVVAVSTAAAPAAGQVLTATSSTAAQWSDPAGDITAVTAGTGLTGGGTTGAVSLAADFGTTSGKIAQGNDSRFTDDRTASGIRTATTVVTVSSATAPTSGQVLTATSGTAATWQNATGGPATQIVESSGPTTLTIGSIADGQLIRRNGSTAVGISQSSLALAASQITSGTLAVARVVSGTALQQLRINSGATAIEAFTPSPIVSIAADLSLTSSDQTVLSFDLPTGQQRLRLSWQLSSLAGTAQRTQTYTFAFSGTATQGRASVRRMLIVQSATLGSSSLSTAALGTTMSWATTLTANNVAEYDVTLTWNVTVAGTFSFVVRNDVADGFQLWNASGQALQLS